MAVLFVGNAQLCFATDYNWKGGKVENILRSSSECKQDFSSSDDSKVFFLYNVATGKFIYQGDRWGTQPVISDKAIALNVSCDNFINGLSSFKGYAFTSNLYTDQGYWLGHKEDKDGSCNDTKYALYFDCKSNGTLKTFANYAHALWNFQELNGNSEYWDTSAEKYTYVIRSVYPATEFKGDHSNETYYLCYDESTGKITTKNYGKYWTDVNGEGSPFQDKNALWKLVTLKEIKDKLQSLGTAGIDDPFDCSFFLADPDFNRNARNNKYTSSVNGWQIGGVDKYSDVDCGTKNTDDIIGLKEGLEHCYTSALDNQANFEDRYGSEILGKEDRKALATTDAKYFSAQMKEFPGPTKTKRASIYQRWTCVMTGWYRITCQAFKQSYDTGDENKTYLYAKNFTKSKSFRHVELLDINDYEVKEGETVSAPTTLDEAAKMFYDGRYTNTVYVYVESGDQLEFGLRFTGQNKWTAFDDFRLAYCGNSTVGLVLNENRTELSHITNASTEYNNFQGQILSLHRTFSPGKWNTIVLPVSLTQKQSRELFGTGTEIAKMTKFENGNIRFDRVEDENTKSTDLVIEANTPYIIKPTTAYSSKYSDTQFSDTEDDCEFKYNSKTGTSYLTPVCPAPYSQTLLRSTQAANTDYMSGTAFTNENNMMSLPGYSSNGLTFHGTLAKTYEGTTPHHSFIGKYIIYNGEMWHITDNYGLDGMRGYFSFDETTPGQSAKAITFSIDGVQEETTAIEGLQNSVFGSIRKNSGKVYNLGGQVVSSNGSTAGLAKGIYIVNGKKVVVK